MIDLAALAFPPLSAVCTVVLRDDVVPVAAPPGAAEPYIR